MGALPGGLPIATVSVPRARSVAAVQVRRAPPSVRRHRFLMSVANHSVAIALSIVFVIPFVFVLLTSLMTRQQALSTHLWPKPFHWSNYREIFNIIPLLRYGLNTMTYASLSAVGVVLSSVPVAYALSRMQWRGRQAVFVLVLATLMLPAQVTSVPLYIIFTRLHWLGSLKPLIVPAFLGAVGLTELQSNVFVHFGVVWNVLMAGSVVFMLPVIVIFFFAQRVFIEGVTLTGVKG